MKKFFFCAAILLLLTSCHVGRFFIYNFADTKDHKKFSKVDFEASKTPFQFYECKNQKVVLPQNFKHKDKNYSFDEFLIKNKTLGFLVIRNDTILYENYFKRLDKDKIHPSFSVAKSYVSAIVGIAINEGFIKNVNESITNYLPELGDDFKPITIEHLLNMRSGIRFSEGYFNPFGDVAKYYYGRNLNKYISKLEVYCQPDKKFYYSSVNTQLLALIVENATKESFQNYFYEKLWSPLGMESEATWSIDSKKNNTVKAFCCLNATARDFAKFGKLYLQKGNYGGKQIVPESWVNQSLSPSQAKKNRYMYSYQWWRSRDLFEYKNESLPENSTLVNGPNNQKYYFQLMNSYSANGFLGQYLYINPDKNIIIVRLGSKDKDAPWEKLFYDISNLN